MLLFDVDNIDCINMKSLEKMKFHKTANDEEKLRIGMVTELMTKKNFE